MPYPDFAEMMGKTLSDAVHEVIGYDQPEVEVLESVVAGHPAQALVDASAHAALVVVGSRGHGGVRRHAAGLGQSAMHAARPLPGGRRARHELISGTRREIASCATRVARTGTSCRPIPKDRPAGRAGMAGSPAARRPSSRRAPWPPGAAPGPPTLVAGPV